MMLLFFLLFARVFANTESILVTIKDISVKVPELDVVASLIPNTKQTVSLTANHLYNPEYSLGREGSQAAWVRLNDVEVNSTYNFRVSWPATYPIQVDLTPECFEVLYETAQCYVKVEYRAKFYTNDDAMVTDLEVPLDFHLVELRYGFIPKDMEPTIAIIVSLVAIGIPLANFVYKFIKNSH